MAQDEAPDRNTTKVRIYGTQMYTNPVTRQLETRRDGRDLVVEIPNDRYWDFMSHPEDSPEAVSRKQQYMAEAFDQFYGTGMITRDDFRHIGGAVGGIGGGAVGGAPGAIAGSTTGGVVGETIAQLTEPREITGGGVTMKVLGVPRETYLMLIGPDEPSEGRELGLNLSYEDRLNQRNPWDVDTGATRGSGWYPGRRETFADRAMEVGASGVEQGVFDVIGAGAQRVAGPLARRLMEGSMEFNPARTGQAVTGGLPYGSTISPAEEVLNFPRYKYLQQVTDPSTGQLTDPGRLGVTQPNQFGWLTKMFPKRTGIGPQASRSGSGWLEPIREFITKSGQTARRIAREAFPDRDGNLLQIEDNGLFYGLNSPDGRISFMNQVLNWTGAGMKSKTLGQWMIDMDKWGGIITKGGAEKEVTDKLNEFWARYLGLRPTPENIALLRKTLSEAPRHPPGTVIDGVDVSGRFRPLTLGDWPDQIKAQWVSKRAGVGESFTDVHRADVQEDLTIIGGLDLKEIAESQLNPEFFSAGDRAGRFEAQDYLAKALRDTLSRSIDTTMSMKNPAMAQVWRKQNDHTQYLGRIVDMIQESPQFKVGGLQQGMLIGTTGAGIGGGLGYASEPGADQGDKFRSALLGSAIGFGLPTIATMPHAQASIGRGLWRMSNPANRYGFGQHAAGAFANPANQLRAASILGTSGESPDISTRLFGGQQPGGDVNLGAQDFSIDQNAARRLEGNQRALRGLTVPLGGGVDIPLADATQEQVVTAVEMAKRARTLERTAGMASTAPPRRKTFRERLVTDPAFRRLNDPVYRAQHQRTPQPIGRPNFFADPLNPQNVPPFNAPESGGFWNYKPHSWLLDQ